MLSKLMPIFVFLISATFSQQDTLDTYNKLIEEIINIKAIQDKIRTLFPDIPESVLLTMFDASTKFPSGLLAGNFFDLGNFDECYNIHYGDSYGKYCLGTLLTLQNLPKFLQAFNITQENDTFIPQVKEPAPLWTNYVNLHFAVCIPSDMEAKDIPGIQNYSEDFCYSKATEPELSTGAITLIAVLSVFAELILVSTAIDVYSHVNNKNPPHEFFVAFSFWSNGRKIFRASDNSDQLLCLNGIKVISMMWVILGHEYLMGVDGSISNLKYMYKWTKDPANMFILGATVSVDTFFMITGLVIVYTFFNAMDKKVKFNFILYYIHRYLRLTPALAVMALFHLYLLNHIATGPLWKVVDITLVETCRRSWWSTLLYISNYIHDGNCLPQSWYLNIDMQLYLLSPIVLFPLFSWPKYTLGFMAILAIAGFLIPFTVSYEDSLGVWMNLNTDINKYLNVYYNQTYARFGPYVIGMISGYLVYKLKKKELKLRLSISTVCLLWAVFLTGLVACVWAGHNLVITSEEYRWGNACFNGFSRSAWAICVAGIIFLCVAGYGKPINGFLSLPVFQILTKLIYSIYLVHYTVITVRYSSLKNLTKFSNIALMHIFWADFAVILFLSLILCLSFESPIITLEKHLFRRGRTNSGQIRGNKPEG